MAYGNGTFVGVGGGLSFVSHDATNWSTYATPTFMYQAGVAFGGGTFMAYGTNSPSPLAYICASGDGMSWRTVFPNVQANTKKIYAAAYGNNTWAFLAYINDANGVLVGNATSATNWNWTQVSLGQNTLSSLYFLNGTFVLRLTNASGAYFYSSPDGVTWQYKSRAPLNGQSYLAYGNGTYVFFSPGGSLATATSADLVNWTPYRYFPTGPTYKSFAIGYFGNIFVAVPETYNGSFSNPLYGKGVWSSTDGINWQTNATTWSDGLFDTYNDYYPIQFLSCGQGTLQTFARNDLYQSGAFITQSNPAPTILAIATYPGITINGAVGTTYVIQCAYSADFTNWVAATNIVLSYSPYVWVDLNVAPGGKRFYRAVQLQ